MKEFCKGKHVLTHKMKLSDDFVNVILKDYVGDIDGNPFEYGTVVGDGNSCQRRKDARNCEILWIDNTSMLASMMWYHISALNKQYYNYDIDYFEKLQLTSYGVGEHYKWHVDSHENQSEVERKLTFSLQLSDEKDYEGGEFQVLSPGYNHLVTADKERGSLTLFDSRMTHRALKVKKGRRIVLVGWATGPAWR